MKGTSMSLKDIKKKIKKKMKKIFTRDNVVKMVVVVSGLLLVLTSILPYIV